MNFISQLAILRRNVKGLRKIQPKRSPAADIRAASGRWLRAPGIRVTERGRDLPRPVDPDARAGLFRCAPCGPDPQAFRYAGRVGFPAILGAWLHRKASASARRPRVLPRSRRPHGRSWRWDAGISSPAHDCAGQPNIAACGGGLRGRRGAASPLAPALANAPQPMPQETSGSPPIPACPVQKALWHRRSRSAPVRCCGSPHRAGSSDAVKVPLVPEPQADRRRAANRAGTATPGSGQRAGSRQSNVFASWQSEGQNISDRRMPAGCATVVAPELPRWSAPCRPAVSAARRSIATPASYPRADTIPA